MTQGTDEGGAPAESVADVGTSGDGHGVVEGPFSFETAQPYDIVEWRQSELSEWFAAHIDSMEKAVEGWRFIGRIDEQVQVAKGRYLRCVEKYINGGLSGFCKEVDLARNTAHRYIEYANMADKPDVFKRLNTLGPTKTYLVEKALEPESLYEWIDTQEETPTYREIEHKVKEQHVENRIAQLEDVSRPKGVFDVIVCDPPWVGPLGFDPDPDRSHWVGRAMFTYPLMSIEEIAALEVPAADDCILWLWTTNYNLHSAFHILEAWGFEYKSVLTWLKNKIGTGYWLRGQTEHCILAVRGKPLWINKTQSTAIEGPMREHSRKPDEFYTLVDSLCHGRKLDMFSREKRDGWEQWGDECDKF